MAHGHWRSRPSGDHARAETGDPTDAKKVSIPRYRACAAAIGKNAKSHEDRDDCLRLFQRRHSSDNGRTACAGPGHCKGHCHAVNKSRSVKIVDSSGEKALSMFMGMSMGGTLRLPMD